MELLAPAKINLFLQVVGRRDDGYHELQTLMCCVEVFDLLVLHFDSEKTDIICSHPDVPCDETNLALKAAIHYHQALIQQTALAPRPLSIHLTKRIPVGAGLGGGSSDAAAVINGLNRHYGRPFDHEQLLKLALGLGADVPFFIDAKPSLAEGIGEKLSPYYGLAPLNVVLVYPGFGISTARVFMDLNLRLTKCEKKIRNFPFKNGDFCIARHLCNDLESVAIRQHPVIAEIKRELLRLGAAGSLMTGSGSAVFGLFADGEAARKASRAFEHHHGWQVYTTQIIL